MPTVLTELDANQGVARLTLTLPYQHKEIVLERFLSCLTFQIHY